MADLRTSSMGGVPKGATADRPASPSIGDVFYNGTLACLEIYTSAGWVANSAPASIPISVSATDVPSGRAYNNGKQTVSFSSGVGGGLTSNYIVTPSPTTSPATFTGSSSPIDITGLSSNTSYTYTVQAGNNFGTSLSSAASTGVTATTIPQAPTIGTATGGNVTATLTFTAGATGGSAVTNYKYSTDGVNYTAFSPAQTSSPLTISALTPGNTYSFYIKAVNTNGDSIASSVSNSAYIGYPSLSGGTLSSDTTYYYRTFISTANLVVSNLPNTVDVLVIAGGGGGSSGGGGAGGLLAFTSQSLTVGNYACTVGGGGASNTNGVDSQFAALTLVKGGGLGGTTGGATGSVGGSGGGGGYGSSTGGQPTVSQGFAGGGGTGASFGGGGGGGAGGVGGTSSSTVGGAGGTGNISYSTWLTAITPQMTGITGWGTATSGGRISGGGGGEGRSPDPGGAAGAGGGGSGASSGAGGTVGITNTGGGGGSGSGKTGGSGIIIVRYTKASVGG